MPNGSIDQLNFEVILNDQEFNRKVQADIQLARDLNTQLSAALNLAATRTALNIDGTQAAGQINRISATLNTLLASLSQQHTVNVTQGTSRTELANMKQQLDNILQQIQNINNQQVNPQVKTGGVRAHNAQLGEQSRLLNQLTGLANRYFSIYGATRFLSTLIRITGEFEVQQMSLRTILGNAEKADVIFEKLRQFAVESPYTFQELTKYTKQLAAFDIPTDKLLETNKMLADVAAGLGVSMDRLILAYGHVKSSGFLRGMQLRSFTQNGVPILEQLADILTEVEGKAVTVGEVFDKMTKRQIDFSMVEEAFRRMTSEGGKFYRMQEVLVDTLQGKIGKLKDVWQQAIYDLGQSDSSSLKGAVDMVTKLISHFGTLVQFLKPVIAGLGAYGTALLMVMFYEKSIVALNYAKHLWILITHLNQAAKVMRIYSMSMAGVLGVATAVVASIIAIVNAIQKKNSAVGIATQKSREYAASIAGEKTELKGLLSQLESAEKGTRKFDNARDRIMSKYGEYLSNLDKENVKLGKTAGLYDKILAKVRETSQAKFMEAGETAIREKMDKELTRWQTSYEMYFDHISHLSEDLQKEVGKYMMDLIPEDALSKEAKQVIENTNFVTEGMADASEIRNNYKAIFDEYNAGRERLRKLFDFSEGGEDDFLGPVLDPEKWQRTVRAFFNKQEADIKNMFMFKPNEDDWYAYQKRISEEYKELMENIENAADEEMAAPFRRLVKSLKELDAQFGGKLLTDKATKSEDRQAKEWETKEEKRITNLVNNLNRIRDAYEKLQEYVSSNDEIKTILKSTFDPDLWGYIDDDSFKADNVLKLIEELGKINPDKAESLKTALGKDGLEGIIEKLKAGRSLADALADWESQDFALGGRGFEFDVNKIVRDYNTAIAKVEIEQEKMLETAYNAYGNDPMKLAEQIERINKLTEANKEYQRVLQQNKIDELAQSYVKDAYAGNQVNLRNLGGATLARINDLVGKIQGLRNNVGAIIPEETLANLEKAGFDTEKLKEAIVALFQGDINNLLDKKLTRVQSLAKKISGEFRNIGDQLSDLGGDLNNDFLEAIGGMIDFATEIADTITESMQSVAEGATEMAEEGENLAKSSDWITILIKLVSMFTTGVIEAIAKTQQMAHSVAMVAEEARRLRVETALSDGVKNLFGEDSLKSAQNALSVMQDIEKAYAEISKVDRGYMGNAFWTGDGAQIDLIEKATKNLSGLESVILRKNKQNFFAQLIGAPNEYIVLFDAAKELGYDLYDQYGHLNSALIEAMLNTYDLTNEQMEWLTQMKDAADGYTKAIEQLEGVMGNVFGQIADSAADKIVDNWIKAGDAALDYVDILDDVAKAYAKMVIKSAIMDNFLDDKKAAEVAKLFMQGDTEGAMATIAAAMEGINASAPMMEQILEAFTPYFNQADEAASTVGDSIKNSINEEQAGLLASYINAMRADLSYMRGRQTQYFDFMLGTVPTLAEHLASIDAHTYDIMLSSARTAESTEASLAEMRSIIGTGTGLPAVRVERIN